MATGRDRAMRGMMLGLAWLALAGTAAAGPRGTISGELRQWHRVTITFDGPGAAESAALNPFKDYRLDVVFTQSARKVRVPGYYAADGNAAQTGAYDGNKWRVHFAPPTPGMWQYRAEFSSGPNIAIDPDPAHGTPTAFDDANSSFTVAPAGAGDGGRDLRVRGPLQATGQRYPRFARGEPFIAGGAASPRNLLAYFEFDQTRPTHEYAPHRGDWRPGDPAWRGGRGKNLIGALNYLAGKGMNAVGFLTLGLKGEGNDVWPWTAEDERYRFDCSKLDQWEIAFSHMDRLGLALHMVTQDRGNDHLLDGGWLALQRKLYYRELVARFAHHPGVIWDLGEEITNTPEQIREFARYLHGLDPYGHPIVVQAQQPRIETVYPSLLAAQWLDGITLQLTTPERVYAETLKWLRRSERARHPWQVWAGEAGGPQRAAPPDAVDSGHDALRRGVLWGNLMAGGAGVEWHFGAAYPNNALNCEDWRSRDKLWDQTRHALEFFARHLPFDQMAPHDELAGGLAGGHCLARPGQVYAITLPGGGRPEINLGNVTSDFAVQWYDPQRGGELQDSLVKTVQGPGRARLGIMVQDPGREWVVLVKRMN